MKNMSSAENVLEGLKDSTGNAEEEFEQAKKSISYSLNELKETWVGIWQDAISSKELIEVIKSLTTVSEKIGAITKEIGTLGSAVSVVGMSIGALMGKNGINVVQNVRNSGVKGSMGNLNPLGFFTSDETIAKCKMSLIDYNNAVNSGTVEMTKYMQTMKDTNPKVYEYIDGLKLVGQNGQAVALSEEQIAVGANQVAMSMTAASIGAKALAMSINMIIGLGVGMLVGVVTNLISKVVDSIIETREELEEQQSSMRNDIEQTSNNIEDLNGRLEEVKNNIEEIQNKGSISVVDEENLNNLKEESYELEGQIALLEKKKQLESENLAKNTLKLVDDSLNGVSGYGRSNEIYDSSTGAMVQGADEYGNTFDVMVYKLQQAKEELGNLQSGTQEWKDKLDEVNDSEQTLVENQTEIRKYMDDMQGYVDYLNNTDSKYWSTEDQKIMDTYNTLQEYYNLMWQVLDPASYKEYQFEQVFDIDGIEYSKEELIGLANISKDGLDEKYITDSRTLSEALENLGITVEEFKGEIDSLSSDGDWAMTPIINNIGEFESALDVFDDMKDRLTDLADVVEALGQDWTLTAEEARKYGEIYPELLSLGQTWADGTFHINEDVANSFIKGKEAEIKAGSQQRITELEGDKAILKMARESAVKELEIAQSLAKGETDIEGAKTQWLADKRQELVNYVIECGATQEQANALALAAESKDWKSFGDIIGQVGSDSATNMANAYKDMATNSYNNIVDMINQMNSYGQTARNAALQTANVGAGKQTFTNGTIKGGSGSKTGGISIQASYDKLGVEDDSFAYWYAEKYNTKMDFTPAGFAAQYQNAYNSAIGKWESDLKNTIASIDDAIGKADAQINFLKATGNQSLEKYASDYGKNKGSSGSGSKKGSSGSKDKSGSGNTFSKVYDWLSIAIENLEKEVSKLDKIASSVYQNWSTRNASLVKEIESITDEIGLQEVAYSSYINQANSIGLSDYYKNLVQNGAIDIENVTDEELSKKIDEYSKWYNAANESMEKILDLQENLGKKYSEKFNNISQQYNEVLEELEYQRDSLEKSINISNAKGLFSSKEYYSKLLEIEKDNEKQLNAERTALIQSLNEAVNSGAIAKYSEEYMKLQAEINKVNLALKDCTLSQLNYNKSIRDLDTEVFEFLQEQISNISSEVEFVQSLFDKNDLYNDNGNLNNNGLAMLGLYGANYNTSMNQAEKYKQSIEELDKLYKNDSLNKDYLERRQQLVELQQKSIKNANNEKKSMVDLIKDGYEASSNALKELINNIKDLNKEQKDYTDYQKEIEEKTKNISKLQKQLNAYSSDSGEENQKTIQELKNQIIEAQQDLDETENERMLKEQEAFMDSLLDEYEAFINERMDNQDFLVEQAIQTVNDNANEIRNTIISVSEEVGYDISDSLDSIFNGNGNNILTVYNDNFMEEMTTLNSTIDDIKELISSMVDIAEETAEEEISNIQELATQQVSTSTATTPQASQSQNTESNNGNSSTNGNPNAGDNSSVSSNFFIPKVDSYPKNKLNKEVSIVDRLKFFNFDSSYSARAKYYQAMGLGSASSYTGTAAQNVSMVQWMRRNGFSQGGSLKSMANRVGEDGFFLGRSGEKIIPLDMVSEWDSLIQSLPKLNNTISGNDNSVYNLQFDMNGIQNYEQFKQALLSDGKFESYVKTFIGTSLTGKNSLLKNRYKG